MYNSVIYFKSLLSEMESLAIPQELHSVYSVQYANLLHTYATKDFKNEIRQAKYSSKFIVKCDLLYEMTLHSCNCVKYV